MKTNFPLPSQCEEIDTEKGITHEQIAQRAYALWLEQGRPGGACDQAIWLEAEAELHAITNRVYRHPQLCLDQ